MYAPLSEPGVNEIATLVVDGTAESEVGAAGGATVMVTQEEPFHTFILTVSVSRIICPVNGDGTSVARFVDVVIVTAETFDASFAWLTAFDAIFPAVTAPFAIFAEVTAPSAIFDSVTEPFPNSASL